MHFLKYIIGLLFFSLFLFNACQDDDYMDLNNNDLSRQESITLQTMLNQIERQISNGVSSNSPQDSLCFQFVYPIRLIYNTQNIITINGFNGLVEVLNNQSSQLYVTGIVMPFQVILHNQTQTINTQNELISLLESCDFLTINEEIINTFCFDIFFPIVITAQNGQNINIDNIAGFQSFLATQSNTYQAEIVFPIIVIYQNNYVLIHNLYEFYEMVDNCTTSSCNCYAVYSPVCIQTPNGIVEFGNMCYAACEGYDQNDIVPCNNGGNCNIFNLDITTGNCGNNDNFSLTLDFDYNNPQSEFFEVYARDSVAGSPAFWDYKGVYPLSQMPITIQSVSDAETTYQSIKVQIKDHPNCYLVEEFLSPNCGGNDGCICPSVYAPVCVQGPNGIITFENACHAECEGYTQANFIQCPTPTINFGQSLGTCFTIALPEQIEHNGNLITVNSNGDILQYYHPSVAPIPNFVYPVVLTFANTATGSQTITVNSQNQFISLIDQYCN